MRMLGRFELVERIGEGAMAEVFRALDPQIGRPVAVKTLKPEFACSDEIGRRFLREARASGTLSHPAIATIYDVGECDGTAYIAMELVEGQALDAAIQSSGRMTCERVLAIGRQLASALDYAHRAGVVHRDVKPSNIMIGSDGRTVKLLDFGVARITEQDPAAAQQALVRTQAGQMVGTPRYMSPEQALGLPVDGRSDMFSLGVVLYEMITGKVAFPGTALATLAIQIAQERVEPIDRNVDDCPPGLRFIIDRLLCKKPDQRFADGAALVAAFDREIAALAERPVRLRGLPLRIKLPLILVSFTALGLFAAAKVSIDGEQAALEDMAITSGESTASFVTSNAAITAADNAGLPEAGQDWSALQAFVITAVRDPQVHSLTIADAGGTIRAASDPALLGRRLRQNTLSAFSAKEQKTQVQQARDAEGKPVFRFIRPIVYAGARFGTVDLRTGRGALDAALATARRTQFAMSALIMLLVLGIGHFGASMIARPLGRLTRALDEAGCSSFAIRISHRRNDEFGRAFDAFNRAAAAIEGQRGAGTANEAAVLETRVTTRAAA